ncbi:hypothetical protein GCM10007382_23740 [Salinibacterium xinjiangense]|nr:hypothetical protein GCM10007382_23740 [Salinibacterium xinjiangense]
MPSSVAITYAVFVVSFSVTSKGLRPTVTVSVTELVSSKHTYRCVGAGRLRSGVPDRPAADDLQVKWVCQVKASPRNQREHAPPEARDFLI